jgi:hypothetical protein
MSLHEMYDVRERREDRIRISFGTDLKPGMILAVKSTASREHAMLANAYSSGMCPTQPGYAAPVIERADSE